MKLHHSPSYALGLVSLLVVVQAHAFFEQWRLGFRPFRVAPERVALSWDMFAVEIERCGVSWDPPSYWQGRMLRELRDLGAPIEWDPIYNRKADYISAAELGCAQRAPRSAQASVLSTGPVRTGQVGTGQVGTGPVRTGQVGTGQVHMEQAPVSATDRASAPVPSLAKTSSGASATSIASATSQRGENGTPGSASFTLHCFTANGEETQDEYACPTSP